MNIMRGLLIAGCCLLVAFQDAPPPAPQENEAEKLFNTMCEKLQTAKTLRMEIDFTDNGGGNQEKTATISVSVQEGNRFRFVAKKESSNKQFSITSNGPTCQIRRTLDEGHEGYEIETPENFNKEALRGISHFSVNFPATCFSSDVHTADGSEIETEVLAEEFALGDEETLNKRKTRIVTYVATLQTEPPREAVIRVWIDLSTHLPVKRTLQVEEGSHSEPFTEVITRCDIDGKVDEKEFQLK